jgi:transposase-like protein
MKCPKCGEEMRLIDKNTFTAEEIREYLCEACRKTVVDRGGIALWKALSDAKGGRE